METQPLNEVAVKAFAKDKISKDTTLRADQHFNLICGGLDWTGSFKKFELWTYYDSHALLKPGFLDEIVKDNAQSYLGARISCECRNMSDDPRDWTFCDVVILEVKSRQGGVSRTVLGLIGGPPRKASPSDDRLHDVNGKDGETNDRKRLK